jgi:hypothetical protein
MNHEKSFSMELESLTLKTRFNRRKKYQSILFLNTSESFKDFFSLSFENSFFMKEIFKNNHETVILITLFFN